VASRRRCRVFVEDHAAVGLSSPRPAARQSKAGRCPQAAACRCARCPRPRAPARPPRSLWLQLPSASCWPPGHRRRGRGALRLSARPQPALRWRGGGALSLSALPQPALRWRLAAARAGRPAPPAPPVGAPQCGRSLPRATIASLCSSPAGDCVSRFFFLDLRAFVATGPDLQGHTMDYDVKEKNPCPTGKKNLCV